MSKSKTEGDAAAVSEAIEVPGLKPALVGFSATAGPVAADAALRVFRDKVFTSRTLIMQSGSQLAVVAGLVTAGDDDQYAFLKAHPDLEQLLE